MAPLAFMACAVLQQVSEHAQAPRPASSAPIQLASCSRRDPALQGRATLTPRVATMPSRTSGASAPPSHCSNGSVNPCFDRLTIAAGSGWSSVSDKSRFCRCNAGYEPERRPDGAEEFVIDKRHTHLQTVRHRHDVHVAQKLRAQDTTGSRAGQSTPSWIRRPPARAGALRRRKGRRWRRA